MSIPQKLVIFVGSDYFNNTERLDLKDVCWNKYLQGVLFKEMLLDFWDSLMDLGITQSIVMPIGTGFSWLYNVLVDMPQKYVKLVGSNYWNNNVCWNRKYSGWNKYLQIS